MSSHPARRYSVLLGSSTSGNDEETNEIIEEPDMDYQQTNVESFEAAAKAVADMLSKPEQLDSLDQIRMNFSRKKTTVETQLRNAVQTQLDGVQNGLVGLKIAGDTIGDIKERMGQVEEVYKQCEELSDIIGPLKEANRRYQQLRTTDVHINNIFGVPHAVEEIRQMIEGGNLLEAHQLLSELEHTRDELLIQLYQSSDAFVDRNTALHRYFEPLIQLSAALGQQLWVVMARVSENVLNDPTSVVTALRIVQREEKADNHIADDLMERNVPLSQIPNRPKKWRDKCMEILETSINNKFSELQPSNIEENREWLDDYLTEVASVSYQDLKAMRENGIKCFPPDYDIMDMFLRLYHANIKEVIANLVSQDLNARDIIKLMIWVGDLRQSFREVLGIDLQENGKLIDENIEGELQKTCVTQVEWNVSELSKKMLQSEAEDWQSLELPDADNTGCFYTTVGILLFEMIDQNVSALTLLGLQTKERVLQVCLEQLQIFQQKYRELIDAKFQEHLKCGRTEPPLFLHYMIAVANNCKSCIEFTERLKKSYTSELGGESSLKRETRELFAKIVDTFDSIGYHCCDIVVTIMFEDLNPVLEGLMTKDLWLNKPLDLINKVEDTIVDYNNDFDHFKKTYHGHVIVQTQRRVIKAYFESLMKKRVVLKKKDERQKAASFIKEEAKKIGNLFMRLSHATNPKYINVMEQFAELISSQLDTAPLIIGGLCTRNPEVKPTHIIAILAMRGDLNKNSCQKLMDGIALTPESGDAEPTTPGYAKGREEKSILSQIQITNPYSLF